MSSINLIINIAIIVVAFLIAFLLLLNLVDYQRKKEEEKQEKQRLAIEKEEATRKAEIERLTSEYATALSFLEEKYGKAVIVFQLGTNKYDIRQQLLIFDEAQFIYLKGEMIPFKKVIGSSLTDDSKAITEDNVSYVASSSTDSGSMIGRAAVGAALFGGLGAVVGASTAKRDIIIAPSGQSSTSVHHDYCLFLNIDDLSQPIREIQLGSDTKFAQTISNVFDIILKRNKE